MNTEFLTIKGTVLKKCSKEATGKIIIPEGVTKIGKEAFKDCSSLTEIVIPEGVKKIDEVAFSGCSSLTEVVIPDSVTEIGWYAFSGCTSLTEIVIPEGVTKIGKEAFKGCTSLTSVVIPESVTEIGYKAFFGCTSLESIVVDPNNKVYDSRNNCNAIIHTESNTLLTGCKNTIIPDSVTKIGGGAFEDCTSLISVVIPDSVTEIGGFAFNGCSSLTEVVIPDSVTKIGDAAFGGCSSLTEIVIPEGVTKIGPLAFLGCTSLTSVVIPEGVTKIGWQAFAGCSSLAKVVIPDSVTEIGDSAFEDCSSLTKVVIPEGVTEIGHMAFSGCSSLTSVVIPEGVTKIGNIAFQGCTSLTSAVIPDSVTKIGQAAFTSCTSLTEIVIPEGVTEIGKEAFGHCTSLESIVVDPNNKVYDSRNNCNAIIHTESNTLLTGCKNTIIPDSVTKIGKDAFKDCSSLTEIVIPEGVTEIGTEAFGHCTSLESIVVDPNNKVYDSRNNCNAIIHTESNTLHTGCKNTIIPEGVTSIRWDAFKDCSSLTEIVIPEGVTVIGGGAFKGCTSLTSVVIPESVKNIVEEAFYSCISLKKVSMPERFKRHEKKIFGTQLKKSVYANSELPLYGMRILATGKLQNYSRDEIKKEIIECGGKYSSTVSDKLDFMICGDKVGQMKIDKATELGIRMISEEEFRKMIGKGDNTTSSDDAEEQVVSIEIEDAMIVSYELIDDERCSDGYRAEKMMLDGLKISVNGEEYNADNGDIKTRRVEPKLDVISEEDLKDKVGLIRLDSNAAYDPIDITVKGEFDIDKFEIVYTNYKYKIRGEIFEDDYQMVVGFSYDGVLYEIPEYIDIYMKYDEIIWRNDPDEEEDDE